ncbi:unnamed protein product [Schistosoma margrebowiei]|uniref:Uncharacterized protein n=1 Tax=Schistosoma margrebowiei TaxID=48269 RepID=A0A183M445_9TREM|nr:unnamed protein product [Schistosoma margrebowiei]
MHGLVLLLFLDAFSSLYVANCFCEFSCDDKCSSMELVFNAAKRLIRGPFFS